MALRILPWFLVTLAMLGGCRATSPDPPATEGEGPDPLSVTRWTDTTELFAEYPPLVVGNTSRFAVHLTQLVPFKAVIEGAVEVQLRGGAGDVESFRVDKPSRPGIFGVDVRPARAGRRELVIILRSAAVSDEHRVGPVDVHSDPAAAAAEAPAGEDGENISFLKEQQWALDFDTAVVEERAIRPAVRVSAEIVPRPGGAADVVAPIDGRLTTVADAGPGAAVTRGQELARLMPPPSIPGDLPQLEQQRRDAVAATELAVRDRERAERLVQAGAAPEKRLEQARAAENQAASRVRAAEAQLAQYNASRTGATSSAGLFSIRAPVTGVIAERVATAGANVTAGSVLFRIVDAAQVHVVAHVPEAQASRARFVNQALLEVPETNATHPVGPIVSVGQVLDSRSRTLPIVFALDNKALGLPVGQSVFLQLLTTRAAAAPVIPASAVVDDAGRPVVFVQTGGEAFERRPVTLGAREGAVVQITSGVKAGERVVTKGAYLVRLASLSTSVPAHGHVH